ncbi:MAG TPA: histidinol dehydrogenase, partial [bacterium]|nr:histidinol dehydrogenase [bacterium]
ERLESILAERRRRFDAAESAAAGIIEKVRAAGDEALAEFTLRFDGVALKRFQVGPAETMAARRAFLTGEWLARLQRVTDRLVDFARRELPAGFTAGGRGERVERVFNPISPVGIYIPAGTAPLVSTVLMTVVPARVAGVREIVLVTPPDRRGRANPAVVATAAWLGVERIFKIGGAQAVAALAFGTRQVPRVAKIVGPGNEYVAAAKRLLYGRVDIDCPAGPSEVVVCADRTAPVEFVKAELAAQAEHRQGLAVLVTADRSFARKMLAAGGPGVMRLVTPGRLVDELNGLAPEHLVLIGRSAAGLARRIDRAGAVFVGAYSPVALGDYLAGPSHVLPTGGAAAAFSGLSVLTFLRSSSRIAWSRSGLKAWARDLEALAELEGLPAHRLSVNRRFSPVPARGGRAAEK